MRISTFLVLPCALTLLGCASTPARLKPGTTVSPDARLYPEILLVSLVTGEVQLAIPVSAKGVPKVLEARVISSPDVRFTKSVERLAAQWRFTPARRRGRSAPDTVVVRFTFGFREGSPCPPPPPPYRGCGEVPPASKAEPLPPHLVEFDAQLLRGRVLACHGPPECHADRIR